MVSIITAVQSAVGAIEREVGTGAGRTLARTARSRSSDSWLPG
jgi:hypothetical protein